MSSIDLRLLNQSYDCSGGIVDGVWSLAWYVREIPRDYTGGLDGRIILTLIEENRETNIV